MSLIQEIDFTKVVTIATVLSSAISIIINKIFEIIQESKKHKRLIKEKIIDTKLDACKSAVKYYGMYFNYLYNSKSTLESLENYEFSKLLGESNKFYEESLKKIQSDGEFHEIILFYDFYSNEDEKIAERLNEKQKNYFDFVSSNNNNELDLKEEKKLRNELINVMDEAIKYFKNKINTVRNDIQNLMK